MLTEFSAGEEGAEEIKNALRDAERLEGVGEDFYA